MFEAICYKNGGSFAANILGFVCSTHRLQHCLPSFVKKSLVPIATSLRDLHSQNRRLNRKQLNKFTKSPNLLL